LGIPIKAAWPQGHAAFSFSPASNVLVTGILFAAAFSLAAQDPVRVLDLTRRPETMMPSIEARNVQNCRPGGRGAGRSGGIPPFTIAIERLDKVEYAMGGEIVVDFRLTNISRQSLPIPTVLLDQFHDPSEGEEAIQFGFLIMLRDASGQEHDITGTSLRGSTKLPYTTLSLGPGESIKIHFPGHIVINDSPTAPPTGEGQLFASLLIGDGECRFWNPVRSNAVTGIRFIGR
jgi:hypothetical protein